MSDSLLKWMKDSVCGREAVGVGSRDNDWGYFLGISSDFFVILFYCYCCLFLSSLPAEVSVGLVHCLCFIAVPMLTSLWARGNQFWFQLGLS